MKPKITIVMPVVDEAGRLASCLRELQSLRGICQLIVVDGGSTDASAEIAAPLADKLLNSPRGRALQMNAGAAQADADILLFLHADTRLPDGAPGLILKAVAEGFPWGRFDVAFDSLKPVFRLIAFMMNQRSRLTGIATGDQAMFVSKTTFDAVGGFPDIALMEDIALSAKLKKQGKPRCVKDRVITSGRRWQKQGVWPTILLMWRLRLAYFFGADPNDLATRYYGR